MHRRTILKGAMILSVSGIITKILGFVYRIYLSGLIGSEGMGLYQLIMPLYLLIWAASSSGLCTAVSKLTAQERAKGNEGNCSRLLYVALIIGVSLATMLSLLLCRYALPISRCILKDVRTAPSLRIISLCFPFMSAGSIIRGYYLGTSDMRISAVSQVLEQAVRMLTVVCLSSMMRQGIMRACMGAVIGMALGEFISFIYVAVLYAFTHRQSTVKSSSYLSLTEMLLAMAVPLTLNRISCSLFSTAENILLPRSLTAYGLTHTEALSVLGELTGMCIPLVMFPSSLLTALATATLPSISESNALGEHRRITSAIHQSTVITAAIAMGTAGILYFYADSIALIFKATKLLPHLLRTTALICPFIYIQVSLSGVLNGMGEQVFIFLINLLSSVISIGFILLAIPRYGLNTFLYGWLFSAALTSGITVLWLKYRLRLNKSLLKQFVIPSLSIVLSCLATSPIQAKLSPIASMTASGIIYLLLLAVTGYIKASDLRV